MKVREIRTRQPVRRGRALIILSFSFLLLSSVFSTTAGAITRSEVISRANSWIKRRVPYSQHGFFAGYRRDCSGFVSMAWKLPQSYSSHTIASQARRIALSALKPGDAILTPGHVELFGGWKDKAHGRYIALEQTTWGGTAESSVQTIPRRAVALRRNGIAERTAVAVASVAKTAKTAAAAIASTPATQVSTTFTVASVAEAIAPEVPATQLLSLGSVEGFTTATVAPAV